MKSETTIRHRTGSGTFKAHPASDVLTPAQIEAIKLSVSDAELQQVLDQVGEQLLALEPRAADKQRVGYTIPGRVPYAVRFGCWDCQGYWPGEKEFQLVLVPDTVGAGGAVLPPEFVRMLNPRVLLPFDVDAWS